MTNFQNGFFDREAVLKSMDAATRKALSKGGAFVRQDAKGSLRYRDRASQPGQPPSVHRGGTIHGRSASLLKELIYFAWDAKNRTVVIGPAATNGSKNQPGFVPQTLEKGGTVQVREVLHRGEWKRESLLTRAEARGLPSRMVNVNIAARPFMYPALERNRTSVVGSFQSSMG